MAKPLFDALAAYAGRGLSSFHTPGHKNGLPRELLSFDVTELPDTDSLFEASGVIREAEQNAARYFGARATCFSAGGCTLAIQAMLALAARPGDTLVCGRSLHPSAVHAMALLDIRPVWVWERNMRIEPDDIREAVRRHPGAAAVYLTSPNYLGMLQDIPGAARVCREAGLPLLVDNAHGSHLRAFGLHPLELGASMTACSAHKTLPVLTGGAYLNIAEPRFAGNAKGAMALFGSTSPNYMIMASLDWCADWLQREGEGAFQRLAPRVEAIRDIAQQKGIPLPQRDCDPVRLALRVSAAGLAGRQAMAYFQKHLVEPEYADRDWAVFLPTPFNTQADLDRLEQAVACLPQGDGAAPAYPVPRGEAVLTPREALCAPGLTVDIERAEGRICKDALYVCPPGMIAAMAGETVTREAIKIARDYGIYQIKVVK